MSTMIAPLPAARFVLKKHLSFLLVLLVSAVCANASVIFANADFKGEWSFNEQKSKIAEGRFRMNAQKIKVSNEGGALVIERQSTTPNGDNFTTSEKLTFDGKTAESTSFGNSKRKSTASWSQDGKQMTINSTIAFERDGNQFEVKITEVWKLSDDGKSLSIDYTSESQMGTSNNTFVYDKKA
jgi:hypothetical protein